MVFTLLKREDFKTRRHGTGRNTLYCERNMDHLSNFLDTMEVPYVRQIEASLCFKTALSDQRDLQLSIIVSHFVE